tara:strand:- start:409 stop:930 length:522 start_codon:yes stop_codon:yes gene_type:complete
MDITLKQYNSEKESAPMVKGGILAIVLIAVLFLFIFIVGWFSSQTFPILVFLVLISLPIIVIFRKDLPNYMPGFIRRFVVDDETTKTTQAKKKKAKRKKITTTKQIQTYYIVAMSILSAMILVTLYLVRSSLRPSATALESKNERALLKIFAALFLTCILGVLVLKFEKYNNK